MKMAYKSLYRTYRPQTFKDVAGQEAIITTLKHAIDEKKIAHAYFILWSTWNREDNCRKVIS